MSKYAEKHSSEVDYGARYASIAIRDQLKEIHQGIPALVQISIIALTESELTESSLTRQAATNSPL